jgi:hypothetical protein
MPLKQARGAYSAPLKQAVEDGGISAQELGVWWQEQEKMDQDGRSFIAHPGYIDVGAKP